MSTICEATAETRGQEEQPGARHSEMLGSKGVAGQVTWVNKMAPFGAEISEATITWNERQIHSHSLTKPAYNHGTLNLRFRGWFIRYGICMDLYLGLPIFELHRTPSKSQMETAQIIKHIQRPSNNFKDDDYLHQFWPILLHVLLCFTTSNGLCCHS